MVKVYGETNNYGMAAIYAERMVSELDEEDEHHRFSVSAYRDMARLLRELSRMEKAGDNTPDNFWRAMVKTIHREETT